MANSLPGIGYQDPAGFALVFDGPSFTQILNDTLGNHGLPGDDLEVAQQELSDLMDAFTADVTNDKDFGSLPQGSIFAPTIGALTAIGAELDAADALHVALGGGIDTLLTTIGVWGIFTVLVGDIQAALYNLYQDVLGLFYALNNQLNFINPGSFGGGL